jgi:tetratricopeptide (TPR) repeat protein
METVCLLVDLTGSDLSSTWQEKIATAGISNKIVFSATPEEAIVTINTEMVAPLVIAATEAGPKLQDILRAYQAAFGPMSDFQLIINSDPTPQFMAAVFEFAVEQFAATDGWVQDVGALCRSVQEKLQDLESAEYRTMKLVMSLRTADADQISQAKAAMGDLASYDYRAAYASGKASEASGNYDEAIESYRNATGMNKLFRPVSTSLGEACLITGKIEEAIAIFQKLDRSNPNDLDRKANLASAFIEKGDLETAAKYAAEAEKLSPGSSRVAEIKAQVLLCQGKVGDAFSMLDQMSEVGPFFAAKLNDLGIKLSQAGKGKSALSLYQKAHKIVRQDLKYKISLNAALACRRLGEFDMALKYVTRCAKEYGSLYPKLAKIKETLLKEQAEKAAAAPVPAEAASAEVVPDSDKQAS